MRRIDLRGDTGRSLHRGVHLVVAGIACWAAVARAAPDEAALGKAEGYPTCAPAYHPETRCVLGLVSRFDEVFPARKVAAVADARPLKRARVEPAIRFKHPPRASGIDDYLSRNRTTGLLIAKGDTVLVERYQYDRTPEHRMTSYSMATTLVAMLVGVALSDGKIRSLDDLAGQYVVELDGTPYGETPIRHLLTMSSGIRHRYNDDDERLVRLSLFGESEGGVATVLPFQTRERAPGERFHYSSADTQVLGLVLRAATGKPLAEYLSEKIWRPMGAEADASWAIDKGGYEVAFTGFNATLRDYGRLGILLAGDGALDGRQIIPADWVRAATIPSARQFEPGQIETFFGQRGLFGYGYQTWILPGKERQFVLRGLRKQHLFVEPKSKLVLVHTAADDVSHGAGDLLSLWFAAQDATK